MKKLFAKFIVWELLLLVAAYGIRLFFGKDIFLVDSANFGWVFGIIDTAYTLIAAFVYTLMYLFGVGFIGAVVILTHIVVMDMDNPFGGLFELKPASFYQTKKYIEGSLHQE